MNFQADLTEVFTESKSASIFVGEDWIRPRFNLQHHPKGFLRSTATVPDLY